MKLMNSYSKLSVSILFTVALSTGFLSIAYVQRAHAFSIDFSGLPGFGDDQGLNFFQGPKGDKGDTGPQGAQGPKGDKGDTGEQGTSKDLETITVSKTTQYQPDPNHSIRGDISVTCPEDTKVSGGGYERTRISNGFNIIEDKPFNNGWKISFFLSFSDEVPDSITVYAQCAKLVPSTQ
jgi:hypothetical protein